MSKLGLSGIAPYRDTLPWALRRVLIPHAAAGIRKDPAVSVPVATGAIRLAKDMGPGHTIVTVLADYGTRYQSKLFNAEFLRCKKLPVPAWIERTSSVSIPFEKK